MPAPFRIYAASAGSGKTYQLTKEYLKLALGYPQPADPTGERRFDPGYFKRILAITFTNDAAGEMKERILGALQRFAQAPAAAPPDDLLAEVAAELAADGQLAAAEGAPADWQREVRARAAQTFELVLYHYADFAVSTIDSFVQRIVTAFTRELGLPASFEVELDSESILRSAVAALLDRANRDADARLLTQTLADYALGQAEEGRSWHRLPDELLDFGKHLFNESVHEAVAQLGQRTLADFRALDEDIRARLAGMETEVRETAAGALAALAAAGLEAEHLAGGASGIYGYFARWERWLAPPERDGLFPTATARKTYESGKWGSEKAKKAGRLPAVEAVQAELARAFEELLRLRAAYLPAYLLLSAVRPFLFHASLLSELNKLVEDISRERNLVLISEFNRRIAAIVLHEPVPFIYERLGEKYRHLLIDEFQDTSVLQWNNLLPLVESAVANGGLSLAVGDAKQAIYRWRGGELEQILRLHQGQPAVLAARARTPDLRRLLADRYRTLHPALEPRALTVNYRSDPGIVAFNNQFFSYVRERFAGEELVEGIFEAGFRQEVPGTEVRVSGQEGRSSGVDTAPPTPSPSYPLTLPGEVYVLFTQDDAPAQPFDPTAGRYRDEPLPGYLAGATLDYGESTSYLTLALVEQALADGYGLGEVAVLCRTRAQSRRLAKFLKERGFPIISADSLALQFAETVNLLVAVMRVLHQGADTLARAEALLLVDRVVRGRAPTPARARRIAELAKAERAKPFFEELRRLGFDVQEDRTGNLGLYELAEKLIATFGLLTVRAEGEYLFRFLDLTLDYSLKFGNNLGNFLAYWDERKGVLSINAPGGTDALTITTVHKAKGLAYGVVIVPFADWSLLPHRGAVLWGQLDAAAKPLPTLPDVAVVRLSKALEATPLAAQRQEETAKTLLDGLNTLYVALTRPRHRLYLLTKAPDEPKTTAPDLPAGPAALGPAPDVAALLRGYVENYQSSVISYQLSGKRPAAQPPILNTQYPTPDIPPKARNEKPKTNSFPLTHLASTPWPQRLRLRRHAVTVFDLEEGEKLGELNRKLHFALRRLLTAADLPRVLKQLTAEGLLSPTERPELEAALAGIVADPRLAPYFAPGLAVETEREILVGGQTRRDYKPDRLVFGAGGRRHEQSVTMLDFKLPPVREADKIRLRDYGQLFRDIGFGEVRGVVYYIGTGEVVEV